MYPQYDVGLELTFAGVHALNPLMINIVVVGSSAVLIPRTTRSATTDSAGFRECAAFGALKGFHDRWGDRRPDY